MITKTKLTSILLAIGAAAIFALTPAVAAACKGKDTKAHQETDSKAKTETTEQAK